VKIVVTGAGSFIGTALAGRCCARGIEVVGIDARPSEGSGWHQADIRTPEVAGLIPDGANALVHLAALSRDPDCRGKAEACFDVNVMGTYRVNKAFFPLVGPARGRIVNISSETGWQSAAPYNGPYAMSKHAIEAYSDALRRELALLGVKVIKIQPGPFKTDMVRGIESAFDQAESETDNFAKVIRAFKTLAGKTWTSAHDPDILAQVIEKALTIKNPKPAYSVKPDRMRSALEKLPVRAADKVYLTLLRQANKA